MAGLSKEDLEDFIKVLSKKTVAQVSHDVVEGGALTDVVYFLDRIRTKTPRHVKAARAKKVLSMEEVVEEMLYTAVSEGKLDIVKYLMETEGADVNPRKRDAHTPLRAAVRTDHAECVKFLLEAGADPNKDYCRYTLLVDFVKRSSVQCVELLVKAGADVNEVNAYGAFPLESAVGCTERVQLLLKSGADVNQADNFGQTALMAAATSDTDCLKVLLKAGAEVNHEDVNGRKAVLKATDFGFPHCVKLLLDAGAEMNFATSEGDTPLNCSWIRAFSKKTSNDKLLKMEAVVKLILAAGANVNMPPGHTQGFNSDYTVVPDVVPGDPREKVPLLVFAAGEKRVMFQRPKGMTTEPYYFHPNDWNNIDLKNQCRKFIRKHLLSLDEHTNLFVRVQRLKNYISEILVSYLLYGCDLEVDWEELDRIRMKSANDSPQSD